MRLLVPALLALTLLATAAVAADGDDKAAAKPKAPAAVFSPSPSGWYAELRGGLATQQLDDADANIAYMERIGTEFLGAPGPARRFSQANAFALELGHRRGNWSFGVATEHQRQRVTTFAAGTQTGAIDIQSLLGVIDVRLTTSVRPARLLGFELGASAGMSFAHYSEHFGLFIFPAPQFNETLSGAYHASAPVAGAHIGWRRPLYGNSWLVARGAWMWRDFGEFKGRADDRAGGEVQTIDTDLVVLGAGRKAKLDATGFQFTTGISHTFGGRR